MGCAFQRISGALLGSGAMVMACPADAQDMTTTTSYGESYDDEEIYDYGQGSTIFTVNINAQIGQDQVPIASQSRYFQPYTPDEIAQAVPGGLDYNYNGATVSVTAWSAPEYVEGDYEVIDTFEYDSYSFNILTDTSVQQTSGDGPDPVVPIGDRGECYDHGTSGDTNFGDFAGVFANCEYAEDYLTVAAGTINTNTHTTTTYQNIAYHFLSIDDAYTDLYQVHPTATSTTSSGTLDRTTLTFAIRRNDAYQVNFTGKLGDTTIFAQSVPGQIDSPAAQAALADLSRPVGYALDGAPVVLVWSDPALTASSSELVSSTTEESSSISYDILTTVTTTHGGLPGALVYIGDRGTCTDPGVSGATNGESADGAQATCEGGVAYGLFPDETNTNTQTTYVTYTNKFTLLTENWLNTEDWQLTATPISIGMIHAAVRGPLYRDASDFSRRHLDSLGWGNRKWALWAQVGSGINALDSDGAGPGSHATTGTAAGGLAFSPSANVRVGVAMQHDATHMNLIGLPELGRVGHTQLGAAGEFTPGQWRIRFAAAHGWAEIDTKRGNALLGGTARAHYHASTWSLSADAGPELGRGALRVRPLAGIDWDSVDLRSFVEDGGIALAGYDDTASRTAISAGLEGNVLTDLGGGATLRLWADASASQVVGGRGRTRDVFFAGTPDAMLRASSASEPGTYGELRGGLEVRSAGGLGFHVGGETLFGGRTNGWRATAGVSASF